MNLNYKLKVELHDGFFSKEKLVIFNGCHKAYALYLNTKYIIGNSILVEHLLTKNERTFIELPSYTLSKERIVEVYTSDLERR